MEYYSIAARLYDDWGLDKIKRGLTSLAIQLLQRHEVDGNHILEHDCRTGTASIELSKLGYTVTGVDPSPDMLKIARNKAREHQSKARFVQSEIANFKSRTEFDAAVGLFETANFVTSYEDLVLSMKGISSSLIEGGVYVFDFNTIYGLRKTWSNANYHRKTGKSYSCWTGDYDPVTRMGTYNIEIFEKKNRNIYQRYSIVVKERGYSFKELRRALRSAGFEDIHFYDCIKMKRAGRWSIRAMVFCRKR